MTIGSVHQGKKKATYKDQDTGYAISVREIGVRFNRMSFLSRCRQIFKPGNEKKDPYFWALKDVSFKVFRGESVFVIGRNGAGKTTLLRVLAGTLYPDEGHFEVRGEAQAFLSMGLGFRRELTGYDNIKLSLLLMGVDKKRLSACYREIEEFTQLGEFLHLPINTYSAGMRSRLAFAIATSVDPDMMLMDEVINAGDEQFRDKCQARVQKMMDQSKTVVICTHNLATVTEIATKVIWIEKGRVEMIGDPDRVVREYRKFNQALLRDPTYDLRTK